MVVSSPSALFAMFESAAALRHCLALGGQPGYANFRNHHPSAHMNLPGLGRPLDELWILFCGENPAPEQLSQLCLVTMNACAKTLTDVDVKKVTLTCAAEGGFNTFHFVPSKKTAITGNKPNPILVPAFEEHMLLRNTPTTFDHLLEIFSEGDEDTSSATTGILEEIFDNF